MLLANPAGSADPGLLETPVIMVEPLVNDADAWTTEILAGELATAGDDLVSTITPSLSQGDVPLDQADQDVIVVTARTHDVPGDPLQSINVASFDTVQAVDEAVVGPVSMAYKSAVPKPVRSGVRNFLNNLQEPVIFLNFLLQLKPGKAVETLGRFTINSTIGAAGLVDFAKKRPFNLPHRPNGFAYTLGYYGVKPGPYMYLPLIGPTTLRDVIGRVADLSVLPFSVGRPFTHPAYSVSVTTLRGLDDRAEADEELNIMLHETADPYAALRDAYMHKRQAEIDELRGKPIIAVSPVSAQPVPVDLVAPQTD